MNIFKRLFTNEVQEELEKLDRTLDATNRILDKMNKQEELTVDATSRILDKMNKNYDEELDVSMYEQLVERAMKKQRLNENYIEKKKDRTTLQVIKSVIEQLDIERKDDVFFNFVELNQYDVAFVINARNVEKNKQLLSLLITKIESIVKESVFYRVWLQDIFQQNLILRVAISIY